MGMVAFIYDPSLSPIALWIDAGLASGLKMAPAAVHENFKVALPFAVNHRSLITVFGRP
jgi:hypothetical protein